MSALTISRGDVGSLEDILGLRKRSPLPASQLPAQVRPNSMARYNALEAKAMEVLKPLSREERLALLMVRSAQIFATDTAISAPRFSPENPPKPADFDLRWLTMDVTTEGNVTRTIICYGRRERARKKVVGDHAIYDARGFGTDLPTLGWGYMLFESLARIALVYQGISAKLEELRLEPKPPASYRHDMDLTAEERQILADHPMFQKLVRPRESDLIHSQLVEIVPAQAGHKDPGDPYQLRVNMAYMNRLKHEGYYDKAA